MTTQMTELRKSRWIVGLFNLTNLTQSLNIVYYSNPIHCSEMLPPHTKFDFLITLQNYGWPQHIEIKNLKQV